MKRSKLEDHVDLITRQLQAGSQYTLIAAELCAMGCQTTSQNLTIWLQRRAARIQARQYLTMPLSTGATKLIEFATPSPMPKNPIPKPPAKGIPNPNAFKNSKDATAPQNITPPNNEISNSIIQPMTPERLAEITEKSMAGAKLRTRLLG